MSGNIRDTKVDVLKSEIDSLLNELHTCTTTKQLKTLPVKYNHLYSTSKTLFNHILKEGLKPTFDRKSFDDTISVMLTSVTDIQNSRMSQYEASGVVGTHLAQRYIPHLEHISEQSE